MARPSNTKARRSEIVSGLRKVMARRGFPDHLDLAGSGIAPLQEGGWYAV
jgi:hypothetical protein